MFKTDCSRRQFPIILAFAATTHKKLKVLQLIEEKTFLYAFNELCADTIKMYYSFVKSNHSYFSRKKKQVFFVFIDRLVLNDPIIHSEAEDMPSSHTSSIEPSHTHIKSLFMTFSGIY